MTASTTARRAASPYLLLTLTPLFWAVNWIIGRGLHADVPPFAMTFYRWLFAIVILAPFAWPHVRRDWPAIRRGMKALVALGIIGVASHNALMYVGLGYTTATHGVILNSCIPVMIVALSWAFLGERLARGQVLGVAISLAGVLVILTHGAWPDLVALELNGGDLLVVLAMLFWSIYTIGLRWRPADMSFLSFLFAIAVIGDLAILPLYLLETGLGHPMHWSWTIAAAVGTVALFSSVLSYIFWNRGVTEVGASVAGLFVHLMPAFGALLAWLLLGEQLHAFHLAGIVLILAGLWLTSRGGARAVAVAGVD